MNHEKEIIRISVNEHSISISKTQDSQEKWLDAHGMTKEKSSRHSLSMTKSNKIFV